jgi:peptide deformylase
VTAHQPPHNRNRQQKDIAMARLTILTAPDPRLKLVAQPVVAVDDAVRRLMEDMVETMYAARGIGLAATQVGVAQRVVVMDLSDMPEAPKQPLKMANPEILWHSDQDSSYQEGCLSVPGVFENVTRPDACKVRYLDEQNEVRELNATGLLATCIQHEIDHLNGTLFVDHLSNLKRNMIIKKLEKAKRLGQAAPVAF